jgi:uncharacterized protein
MTPSRRTRPGRVLAWLAVLAILVLLIAIPNPQEFARAHGAKRRVIVATGGTGGVWYVYGGGLAKLITSYVPGVEATAEVTAASIDNLKLLAQAQADLAFVIADALKDAIDGTESFKDFGRVPARTIAVLYPQPVQLVTVAGTGIESIQDLRGKVVSIGAPGSGTEIFSIRMLQAAGLDAERDIRPQRLSVAESVNAIKDRKIDAFVWNSGLPAGAVLDLANTPGMKMRMLPTDGVLAEMQRRWGAETYFLSEVPQETYPGMTEDVPTVAVAAILVAAEDVSDELAYEITRAMFEKQDELTAVHPSARLLTLETAVTGSPATYHPGAIRYYRERGAWPE